MNVEETQDELALRIIYELMFDIIPIACISDSSWFKSSLRDSGHHRRMTLLFKRYVKLTNRSTEKYGWMRLSILEISI